LPTVLGLMMSSERSTLVRRCPSTPEAYDAMLDNCFCEIRGIEAIVAWQKNCQRRDG
jgi:hypothetical protein